MNPESIAEFHREALRIVLSFLKARGIKTVKQLNAMKGRKLLAEPLWKLLELNGKYGGAYISEGVKLVEERLGTRVCASTGTWSSRRLDQVLGPVPKDLPWQSWCKAPEYSCNLEHVVEIRNIIDTLLTAPESLDAILDNCLLGCVVLRSEHARLGRGELDVRDPWKRYRLASPEIRVWCRDSGDWVKLNPR